MVKLSVQIFHFSLESGKPTTRKIWSTGGNSSIFYYFYLFFSKFKEFEKYAKIFNNDDFDRSCLADSPVVFMRWKEQFTLPRRTYQNQSFASISSKVTKAWFSGKIQGASYDGFYYICYSKARGVIEGYYFGKDAEPNQHINLSIVKKHSTSVFKFM